jgi:hypothetical protein
MKRVHLVRAIVLQTLTDLMVEFNLNRNEGVAKFVAWRIEELLNTGVLV